MDGFTWHSDRDSFERDRDRGSQLACLGWHEVRFAAEFVMTRTEEVTSRIRRIVAARAALFGVGVAEVLRPE